MQAKLIEMFDRKSKTKKKKIRQNLSVYLIRHTESLTRKMIIVPSVGEAYLSKLEVRFPLKDTKSTLYR